MATRTATEKPLNIDLTSAPRFNLVENAGMFHVRAGMRRIKNADVGRVFCAGFSVQHPSASTAYHYV